MIAEILTVAGVITTITALSALGIRQRRRVLVEERQPIEDWPTMEARLRQRSVSMAYERKVADARMIVTRACRGSTYSRRYMRRLGMSETRWRNAVDLLRDLGIYDMDGNVPMMSERRALRKLDWYEQEQVPPQIERAASKHYVTPR